MNTKTTHETPTRPTRVVFRFLRFDERGWRAAAMWSAVGFAWVLGASAIGIAYWTGDQELRNSGAAVRLADDSLREAIAAHAAATTKRRAIDGMPIPEEEPEPSRYYAVVVDDMEVARPQAGLEHAPLVIEAPVEGGITRLLAFFPDSAEAARIGPVRSARPYFLDWAREFDALFVHVGGSPEALEKLAASDLRGLNEFAWGKYFWRDAKRRAPHNVYTSIEKLKEVDERRFAEREAAKFAAWRFKEDASEKERPTEDVALTIGFIDPRYKVVWRYERDTNQYRREQGGSSHRAESGPVRAKNVVVQYTKVQVVDEVGRRRIATVGSGDALIALDGLVIHGKWKKERREARTLYLDASGNPIRFNAGNTWIEVVPADLPVDY